MAGIVGFSAARGIGREWLSTRLPARVQRFEKRLVERGLETVVIVRVLFFLAPYAHWALGLSPVSFRTFLLGSAIGFLPAMLIISLTGAAAFEWLAEQPRELWMGLGAVFLASVMGWRFWISRRSGRADRSRAARRDRR